MSRAALAAAAALALFVLAAAGYWAHAAWDKHAQQRKVTELLRDTTEELRRGLAPRAAFPGLVARIDENLQAATAPRDPRLAEAAGLYILGAREIVRRRVEAERLEREAAASREALAAHMARNRRNDAWFRGALELKQRVEREHRDLDITLKAMDDLLYSLPEAEKQLAPHVSAAVLLEEDERREARRQLELRQKRAAAALEKVRALATR
jgi:hypothetical protein